MKSAYSSLLRLMITKEFHSRPILFFFFAFDDTLMKPIMCRATENVKRKKSEERKFRGTKKFHEYANKGRCSVIRMKGNEKQERHQIIEFLLRSIVEYHDGMVGLNLR